MRCDVASLLFGRHAVVLAIRLRWPCIAITGFGAMGAVIAIFVRHWASGGLGQHALSYKWPLWLQIWMAVGWWLNVCVQLLWVASLQREIAWMALKQASTLWVVAMTLLWVGGWVHHWEFGVHLDTWVGLPAYVGCLLFFPLVAMADALPPALRIPVLRGAGPLAISATGAVALVLRLPTADNTPGALVWASMGTETVTNLHAIMLSGTVLTALLIEGVLSAWLWPKRLAFIVNAVKITEVVARAAAPPSATVSVAPEPQSFGVVATSIFTGVVV